MNALRITCFVLGLAAIAGGAVSLIYWIKALTWRRCRGRVIDYKEIFSHQEVVYFPLIEYENDGKKVTFESSSGVFPAPTLGATVTVLVDDEVGKNRILSIRDIITTVFVPWGIGWLLIILGRHTS